MILFRLPEDVEIPFEDETVNDRLVLVNKLFRENIEYKKGRLVFHDEKVRKLFALLRERGCLKGCSGDLKSLTFLPVNDNFGFLSSSKDRYGLLANSSFFIMNIFDFDSIYDTMGTPLGLMVKDGKVLNPPLFDRPALLVRNGEVSVEDVSLKKMVIKIGNQSFDHANSKIYMRPDCRITPKGGYDHVIVGHKVLAVNEGGKTVIPCGGFVLKTENKVEFAEVKYEGLEDVSFGLQVGGAVLVNGKPVMRLHGFDNTYNPLTVSYPPTFYSQAKAPRMVLGSDRKNKPLLIWLEGAGKFGYKKEEDSSGASLKETVSICRRLGVYNGINLDGGGSAQILINGLRHLKVSDRDPETLLEEERGIPVGLVAK